MSASQQAPDPQSETDLPSASSKPSAVGIDGAEGALEAESSPKSVARAKGAQLPPETDPLAYESVQRIVEGDASSDDLQPMLDLRFPDELTFPQLELAAHDYVSPVVKMINGTDGSELAVIPPHENGLDAAIDSQLAAEVSHEVPSGARTGVPGTADEPAVADESAERAYHAEALAPLPSADDPSSAPDLYVTPAVAPAENDVQPPDEVTLEVDANASLPPLEPVDRETAAQEIAAEANATAEALENLKRLLAHKMPLQPPEGSLQRPPFLQAPAPPAIQEAEPAQLERAHHEEFPPHQDQGADYLPASAADARQHRGNFEIRGFLAGFALSWALGAALYVYLIFS